MLLDECDGLRMFAEFKLTYICLHIV